LVIILAETTRWLMPSIALLGMAAASVAILGARKRPMLPALTCWAALALCVVLGLVPLAAGVALAAAVAAAVARDRMPAGLAWAAFAWLTSLAGGWTLICVAGVPARHVPEVLSHTAAALAAWWMLAAGLTRRWPDRWAAEARAAFIMTAATAATASLILLTYSAVGVTYWRLTQTLDIVPIYVPSTAWQGLIDIALLIGAAQLSRLARRWTGLPVAMLWLVLFAGTWWGLMLPPAPALTMGRWPGWLTWLVWMQTAWSWTLLAAVLTWVWRVWRVQERAWPGSLGSLVRVSRPWPGLEPTVTAIGYVLLPLGLWHAFSTGADGHQIARVTTWDMAAGALGLSIYIGWRWSRTVAELALSLWTLALAASAATTAQEITRSRSSIERLPVVHTGVLAGLTAATLLWFWLAGVWRQQLRDGRAWTTAGRLIPLVVRVGFLAGALAVLVGAKLALWPGMTYGSADNSWTRLTIGSTTYALLMGTCAYAASRVYKQPTMWWLTGLAAAAWGLFLWLRC
jgi:hypothetical protein